MLSNNLLSPVEHEIVLYVYFFFPKGMYKHVLHDQNIFTGQQQIIQDEEAMHNLRSDRLNTAKLDYNKFLESTKTLEEDDAIFICDILYYQDFCHITCSYCSACCTSCTKANVF